MVCYFDSSFILSALLEERPAADHSPWDKAGERLSSDLLRLECWVALRRVACLQPPGTPADWADERMARLESYFERVTFRAIDASIEAVVRHEVRLAGCRTLDAIHLATALYFSPHIEEPLIVCSFDARMRAAASAMGLSVLPAAEHQEARRRP